jgi:hypothetical protein
MIGGIAMRRRILIGWFSKTGGFGFERSVWFGIGEGVGVLYVF